MIIPDDPAALQNLTLLIALDTIPDVILMSGPSTRASSLIFAANSMENRHLKIFDNETARLSAYRRQSKLTFHHHF